jgi:hypothetical protein
MGSQPDDASKEAERAERRRREQIDASVRGVNAVYDSPERQKQYDEFFKANRDLYTDDLNRQNDVNNRQLKFAMARGGQSGSSVARDQGKRAGDTYSRGVIEAERRAPGDLAGLKGSDEQSKLNLIALAQSGLDVTTAANQAAMALRNNLEAGQGQRNANGLGDIFGGFADIFSRSREEQERRRALNDYNLLYAPSYNASTGGN